MAKNFVFIPDGYRTISNCGGIEIMINKFGDGIIYKYFGRLARRWQQVKFTAAGRAFFTIHGRREYLENYLRINY